MPLLSSNGTPNITMLNSVKRKSLPLRTPPPKIRTLLLPLSQSRRADTSKLSIKRDKLPELLITLLLINSLLEDSSLASHPDLVNQPALMVTFWRVRSLNSTSRRWKRRRSELLSYYLIILSSLRRFGTYIL
jgi:hypothetical protein